MSGRDPALHGLITCTPDICGGEPCIAGTRHKAATIARTMEKQQMTVGYVARSHDLKERDVQACIDWGKAQGIGVAWNVAQALAPLLEQLDTAGSRVDVLLALCSIRDICQRAVTEVLRGVES